MQRPSTINPYIMESFCIMQGEENPLHFYLRKNTYRIGGSQSGLDITNKCFHIDSKENKNKIRSLD